MSTYYTLLTNVGLAKMINAQALGTVVQWSAMAVGDGNGNPTNPTQTQTALLREKYRAPLNQLSIDPENPNYLIAEMIIPATVGGWTVHEVGVFDDEGDMVAVANFPMTYKPVLADGSTRDLVIRIIVEVSNAATVELKIDPAVVLASRQWVMTNYVEKVTLNGGTVNQVLRKASNADLDVEWADPMAAVQVIVVSREETQTLAAAQTIVDLAVITTDGCAVYIEGVRLLASDFTRTTTTRITLAAAYPAGTKVTIVQNEETGDYPQATEVQKGIAEVATAAEVTAGTDDTRMVTPLKLAAKTTGRLLRTTVYRNNAGTLQASVDGGAYADISSTFAKHPDAVFAEGEALGGGASGANAAATGAGQVSAGPGGGGGGWSFIRRPIASFNGVTISVGAGGVASANQAGGSSAIGALITAPGGLAVTTGPAATATNIPFGISDGGTGSGGDINSVGGVGEWSLYSSTPQSGTGGGSRYGFGPTGVGGAATTGTLGNNAVSPGCGGSGAACGASVAAPKAGGAGAPGLVIIREYQ